MGLETTDFVRYLTIPPDCGVEVEAEVAAVETGDEVVVLTGFAVVDGAATAVVDVAAD